ncbi:MAG: radical SAM protein [Candidatus Latescibacteria bacterium]|nr:radical SAM protein [Candidatus Latescibacterota bacterium]NIM20877.1 radical SAM protein [Candidatus Latescibacterota bacterium]NIM65012.1 radical SAM protein [Candidatus Latescibacterota bacterium]NIO01527.1 radical SAM protein [Candidatus Latescibacterota bacterium]NIO28044.1 radical SAM protein [Candidatus Latescibacterota bacterium]
MGKVGYPTDAILAVTYRCDAKCEMCNIWQLKPQEYLTVDDYAKVPSTLDDINISGGEAFMRKDIVDIVKAVNEKCKGPRIVISTNGFRTEKIIGGMEELRRTIPNIGIGVSVDGIGEIHDKLRGVEGAFEKAMATLKQLKEREFKNVRIGFTTMNENAHEMKGVYELACAMGFQFTTAVAQNSEIYFSTQANDEVHNGKLHDALGYVIKKELMSYHPKRWMRAYYESGSLVFNKERRRILECSAGIDFFYLAPEGLIYPCLTIPEPMGDLKGKSFEEVWESEQAETMRKKIKGCEQCWMICTARSALKKNLPGAFGWIAKEKIKSRLTN